MTETEAQIVDLLRRDQVVSGSTICLTPLSGGISSHVFLVDSEGERFVVKQALPQLKVKELWQADTSRNRYEYEFLKYVADIEPGAVPAVFAIGNGYFTMEYLGPEFKNWKQLLLSGHVLSTHAERAASIIGKLHRVSSGNPVVERLFDTTRNFHQLRTDPYLLTTGQRHPALREYFEQEATRLERTRECLVHGDYSPKNLLVGDRRLVVLDCEVAWYGDPAFDLTFLLNHLFLKSLYHAPNDLNLEGMIRSVIETYFSERKLEQRQQQAFESRAARLLLLLLLARIDGKSPVEYLTSEEKRDFVRKFVIAGLHSGATAFSDIVSVWFAELRRKPKIG